jgi:hypothetical protein
MKTMKLARLLPLAFAVLALVAFDGPMRPHVGVVSTFDGPMRPHVAVTAALDGPMRPHTA